MRQSTVIIDCGEQLLITLSVRMLVLELSRWVLPHPFLSVSSQRANYLNVSVILTNIYFFIIFIFFSLILEFLPSRLAQCLVSHQICMFPLAVPFFDSLLYICMLLVHKIFQSKLHRFWSSGYCIRAFLLLPDSCIRSLCKCSRLKKLIEECNGLLWLECF